MRQRAAGIAALADQAQGHGGHAHVQQDGLALGRDAGGNRVGRVDRVDAAMGAYQPDRRVRGIHHGHQATIGEGFEVSGQATDMRRTAHHGDADTLLARTDGGTIQGAAHAIRAEHIVAIQ
ncbi:hypothetical protein D9M71_575640 [compost metagenome]